MKKTDGRNRPRQTDGEPAAAPAPGALLAGFAASTGHAILFIDGAGLITYVNPAAETMFGHAADAMLGRSVDLIIPKRLRGGHQAGVARVAAGQPSKLTGRSVEVTALRRDGSEFPIELSLSVWDGPDGIAMGGMIRDISERRQSDHRLQRLAHHDPLTGLANRTLFETRLAETIGAGCTLLLIDLDGFKAVNDGLGHAVGDALLQAMVVRLASRIEPASTLARFSGDQFALLTPGGQTGPQGGDVQAVLDAFATPFRVGDHLISLGATVGSALAPQHAENAEDLLASADLALQAARQAGSDHVAFEPQMRSATILRRIMKDELREAVAGGELELFYQPQVSLDDGRIVGAEALLRWRHPRRGLLAPAAFLPALANHTLALQVGSWILDEACRQATAWRTSGHPQFRMAVNLFPVQLDAGNLVEAVRTALAAHQLPPEALELEATETIMLDRNERALAQLSELRGIGLRLAFDDFGTGYASLATLKRFPLTTLKIDRGFVRDLALDQQDAAIIGALLALGRHMDLEVVAEGVETEAQAAILRDMGCRFAQGYLYSQPVPAAQLERLLAATRTGAAGNRRRPRS